MKLKYNFVTNEVADKIVAVPVGDDLEKFNGFVKMNDVGAYIFNMLKNDVTEDEIVAANAKFIGRWDPAAYAQGKFEIQKTAFVQKEPVVEKIQIESKHILVKVDYTGKIFRKGYAFAKN